MPRLMFLIAVLLIVGVAQAQDSTKTEQAWLFHAGVRLSDYKYEEPGLMNVTGNLISLTGSLSRKSERLQVTAELRYGFGDLNYQGSLMDDEGNLTPFEESGFHNSLIEPRVLVGRSFSSGSLRWFPSIGFGLRYLYYDGSKSDFGYDRRSVYRYIPIQLQLFRQLGGNENGPSLGALLEYDRFLGGTQTTYLSDVSGSYVSGDTLGVVYPDIDNDQSGGTGFKASFSLTTKRGSAGHAFRITLYYESWRIDQSDLVEFQRVIVRTDPANNIVDTFYAFEPENRTREIGLQVSLLVD